MIIHVCITCIHLTVILPPFKIKAGLSLNVSETLVIQGPYGTVWVKGNDGQWTQDDNEQTTGQEYLDSLSIQTATQVTADKSILHDVVILPPFKIKAGLSLNVSETLVIQGPYGTVWVKGNDGQWTQDDNEQTTGQEYLDSLSIQTATQVTVDKSVKGQLAGIVVGTIIGTLVFVVFIFIIGCGVNKFRKHKKEKRSEYIDLENSGEIRELTAKIQN